MLVQFSLVVRCVCFRCGCVNMLICLIRGDWLSDLLLFCYYLICVVAVYCVCVIVLRICVVFVLIVCVFDCVCYCCCVLIALLFVVVALR